MACPGETIRDADDLQATVDALRAESHADAHRAGRLEGLLRSVLVAGDDLMRDLTALHFEARPSVLGWRGVAELARSELGNVT